MSTIKNFLPKASFNTLITGMSFLVMLITAIVIYSNYGTVNSDGILYIEMAKQIDAGNWDKAIEHFRWPFYPILIALVHHITGFGFQLSAHSLTVIFWGISAAGLMTLVKELGGGRLEVLFAGLLLATSPYIMESMPPMIIRDHGLGSFHIWSLVFFLRFYQNQKLTDSLLWGCSAILAVLFRIEALTYFVLLPTILLLIPRHTLATKIVMYTKANLVLAISTLLVSVLLIFNPELSLNDLGRLNEPVTVASRVYEQLQQGLTDKADVYADKVLGEYLDDYALTGLILTLLLVLISKAALSAGWVQLFSALLAAKHRIRALAFKEVNIMHWLLLLGIINAMFILLSVFVLSSRYMLPISLLIIAYASFGLAELKRTSPFSSSRIKTRWLTIFFATGLILQSCYILWPANKESRYEIDAANWVSSNLPPESMLYFSQGRTRYYFDGDSSSRDSDNWDHIQQLVTSGQVSRYDYIVVQLSSKHPEQEAFLSSRFGKPLASFVHRHKYVAIFQIGHKK